MARASGSSTKFASVNLNKSYGKPATSQGAQLQGSGGSRSRSHGGMVLLSRPTRSQPAVAATAVLQKGSKLTVPLPVNLPSLRREHAGNDPNIALVGGTGASGWPKQQQQKEAEEGSANPVALQPSGQDESSARSTPALSAVSTWGTSSPAGGQPPVNPAAAHFVPVNGEVRPPPSSSQVVGARSGVYTPPRARTVPPKVNAVQPPPRPVAVEKAVVLRGEDFPTLQAALPPPAPPQQRQKELQQKQREKQQELKDQQQKLQLLSQRSSGEESRQPRLSSPELEPAPGQPSQQQPVTLSNGSGVSLEPQVVAQGASKQGLKSDGISSYGPPPLVRVSQRSNWTDDEREPAHSLRPTGAQGQYSDWTDRPERDYFHDDPRRNGRGDEYGFGRQSSIQRDSVPVFGGGNREVSGRELDSGRENGFGTDGYARDGMLNSNYSSTNRDERYGREGIGSRDGFLGREGGHSGDRSHFKDGGYNRESGVGRDGGFGREGAHGRQGGFAKDSNLPFREGFGRSGGGGRDFTHEREAFHFRDGFAKDNGPRDYFYKESNFGRDGNFNRDGPYGRENRRPQSGDFEGGRGRYGGDRFFRAGLGRFGGGPDFSDSKKGSFASGRGLMGFDSGLDFSREKRFGAPYSEDAFARDFPDLPGLEFRSSGGLGEGGSGVESKLLRRKKEEAQVSAVYDLEREAFEAELERVQKLQEQERLRKIEEKERALEQARKEQEEQERLAREEAERLLRLEEEAREALVRAEQEALEAARKIEEERKAREDEKKIYLIEEERRKENARRKLVELEERIAKREAERKSIPVEEVLIIEKESYNLQRQVLEYDMAVRIEPAVQEEVELASQTGAEQDDDDRAPLRPSRRPVSPSQRPHEDFPSRLKSPDVQSIGVVGRRIPDFSRGGNAFEGDRTRPFMSWRRDVMDNGLGTPSMYGRDDVPDYQFPSRERMQLGRRDYSEREFLHARANSGGNFDGGTGEYPQRRSLGHQERRWTGDEAGSFNNRSVSPRATTPDGDGSHSESTYERDGDRHWGRDKLDRQRSRDGRWGSPPPPSTYLQGPDAPESTSYGRLRQSLAKQPRVPPPLRTPVHHAPLKPGKDFSNSFPSPLLRSGSDDAKGSSWQLDGASELHSNFSSSAGTRSQTFIDPPAVLKQAEPEPLEPTASAVEKSEVKELSGLTASLRPQRIYLQSAKDSPSESHDGNAGQQVVALDTVLAGDPSLHPATSESGVELGEASDEEQSPRGLTEDEVKFERNEGGFGENEEGEQVSARFTEDADLQKELDIEDEAELDEDDDFDDEVGLSDEVDLDDEADLDDEVDLDGEEDVDEIEPDEDVAGEWEDELDQEGEMDERGEEHGSVEFHEEFHAVTLERKEDSEADMNYKEYEEAGVLDHGDVGALEEDLGGEGEHPESAQQEPTDFRDPEKDFMQYQSVPQPYLQHPGLGASVPLTSVVAVQSGQGENFGSQIQQPLSFMALSLPQSHSTSATTQVPSLVASLPVLQNPQDGPVTVQFGLLPSTSLIPPSVPAIQIGSIQMPLHLHPQSGQQPPLFQFGQLGHQPPLPSFVHSVAVPHPPVQPQGVGPSPSHPISGATHESVAASLQGNDVFTSKGEQALDSTDSPWMTNTGQSASRDVDPIDEEGVAAADAGKTVAVQSKRRAQDRTTHEARIASFLKGTPEGGSDSVLGESSSSENSLVTGDALVENQGGESSWNRLSAGGRGRGGAARGGGPIARGRSKSSAFGGRGAGQGTSDGAALPSANYATESGMDSTVRQRSTRRSSYRRTEFKVRDTGLPSDRAYQEGVAFGKQAIGREKPTWPETSVGSSFLSDAAGTRDAHRESASHFQDRKYYGETGQSAPSMSGRRLATSSQNKIHRSSNNDTFSKPAGRGAYGGSSGPGGVLGKYSAEVIPDSSTLHHHGANSDDDFIEVRSKRQMLNDRREQKEKELKAKTKDLKAKEQAARKQRAAMKGGFQGDSGSRSSGLGGPEKRTGQTPILDAGGSLVARPTQSGVTSVAAPAASLPVSSNAAQLQPPIGTPAGGSAESSYDKRLKNSKARGGSISSGNMNDMDVAASAAYDNNDNTSSSTIAWGGSRSTLQVVSLTQIQLEEAMKPVRFESPVPQQLPFGERPLVLEPVVAISSTGAKEKLSAPASGPLGSLLAGEKIQFGAVTSPPLALPGSRPITPGLSAVVGSTIGPRVDGSSEENELKNKSKRLSGAGKEVGSFSGKSKRTRGDEERGGDVVDAEAEAATATAVAVAAISSDESIGSSTHHGDGQNLSLRAVGLQNPGNQAAFGQTTGLHGMSIGDVNADQVLNQGSGLDENISVALPADLSVEPTSISLQGPASSSTLLLPSLPGPYRGMEMGTILGGPMFGFGASRDGTQGLQGTPSGSIHDQGISSTGSASSGWQAQPAGGGVDSYYAGHPSSYTGPFINPTGGIPPMLVYTNPFASVSQFGQLGVSFMGPQQYMPSGKPPDWKHTPPTSAGMSASEVGGLGGIIHAQRSSSATNNAQRMAPGSSLMSSPGPFDLNLSTPFQIPGVEVSMQSQWSHVPGQPLHTVPISGPLMGLAVPSRHPRAPNHLGHLPPHVMETTSGFNLVPPSNPVSSGLFQSVDPAAQFPDELGLGDSSSSVTNNSTSFRGPRTSNRAPAPASGGIVAPSGTGVGVTNKLRTGRRASRVARASSSLAGAGTGGSNISNVGIAPSSVAGGQPVNGSRAPSPHLNSPAQSPPISLGLQSHPNPFSDPRSAPQQGLPRVGVTSGGWSGQVRKGGPGRPPSSERGASSEKPFTSASSGKLKQVYVVKPSSSPRRNMGDATSNLFGGAEAGKATVSH